MVGVITSNWIRSIRPRTFFACAGTFAPNAILITSYEVLNLLKNKDIYKDIYVFIPTSNSNPKNCERTRAAANQP
jgi:hypothetical protein